MPAFRVSRSITIGMPIEEVFDYVRDFRRWSEWSPWLISEPGCPLEFAEDGSSYSWDGTIIGSGQMALVDEVEKKQLKMDLFFLKPWKSQSEVNWHFEANGGGTKVTWKMDGSLPLLMFWMKNLMVAMVSSDYDRGLAMMKEKLEDGIVRSKLDFGAGHFDGMTFVGVEREADIPEIGMSMEKDMDTLRGWLESGLIEPDGKPMSIYHKWDVAKGRVKYSLGVPVSEAPEKPAPQMVSFSMPEMETYTVTHTGAYSHLGNAWSAGYGHGRAKQFRHRKGIDPFEIYESDPRETDPAELVTVVHFPKVS
ncbi:MAG: SRPBCC family protein [Verrucomicrobiota bacterium]